MNLGISLSSMDSTKTFCNFNFWAEEEKTRKIKTFALFIRFDLLYCMVIILN